MSLLPIVGTDRSALDTLAQDLSDRGFHVTVLDEREVPAGAYDPRRRQYRAQAFVDRARKESTGRVLAVTDLDLCSGDLNFVFGLAESPGRAAVISLHRLRVASYHLRVGADPRLFRERAVKEAVHELGHTLGVSHCPDPRCVMHFSNSLQDTDRKGTAFCGACMRRLHARDH